MKSRLVPLVPITLAVIVLLPTGACFAFGSGGYEAIRQRFMEHRSALEAVVSGRVACQTYTFRPNEDASGAPCGGDPLSQINRELRAVGVIYVSSRASKQGEAGSKSYSFITTASGMMTGGIFESIDYSPETDIRPYSFTNKNGLPTERRSLENSSGHWWYWLSVS
jgi:hypothetical protein